MLVVVPTAQAGRLLRESLAEAAGGLLAPKVVTPGHFLRTEHAAPESVEQMAWIEVMESVRDWTPYAAAFPLPPGEGEPPGWAMGLGKALAGIRASLQENALTISEASHRMGKTVEGERWEALSALEYKVEQQLARWGYESRSRMLARGTRVEPERRIVLAGVPDFPAAAVRHFAEAVVLIGAPEEMSSDFDDYGRPGPDWTDTLLAWPQPGSVTLTADPRQQAAEAMQVVAAAGTPSHDLALGSADEATAGELVRSFGRGGWVLHDPSNLRPAPLKAWLAAWRQFVSRPDAGSAVDLLGFAETSALTGGKRAQRVMALSAARDQWLARDRDDLQRIAALNPRNLESIQLAIDTLESLMRYRSIFLRDGVHAGLRRLLDRVDPEGRQSDPILEWSHATAPLANEIRRDAGFWIDLLCASLPDVPTPAPEDRVLDVQGWLELFHAPGQHLVICGMNEGQIPGRASTDAWLPEGTRKHLGLSHDAGRHARDAYLLMAMTEARRAEGRVDLLLTKTGADGGVLLPSRLLLAADEKELPVRVKQVFREVEPPDSSLAWTLDEAWKWQPPAVEKELRISVTTFADYLACPFRFYLKYVAGMSEPEPERVEWNQRDFGNVAHIVVEHWAVDEQAKDFAEAGKIEKWVHDELDRVIAERFGAKVPLAVRIQRESLRQRLSWFSRIQAEEWNRGWRIEEIEKKFELEIEGATIVGRVDRIERNIDGRRRVLDYKTGTTAGVVESSHRTGMNANTRLPAHLQDVPEILCTGADGKPKRWKNLQVALYSAALGGVDELGYFQLGATEGDVKLSLWDGFSIADRESAMACAGWVVRQVKDKVFWPPAEKVDFDDFKILALGRSLDETVAMRGGAA
ncbi:PD-(D/E)XK nuclease family protein [Luteolibacter flavescens]|uniref:PD-(D/E)XK nuclease family protein n=1 Tax=Luteolibacter flavescens TaxID=1859460 RepID=A0ABT3FR50_9BACT|nr:PD-(D/E)XK nuclease family protein [Luteolibacter flavescens]MCW1885679.1 PD-(D/E)XK nuclease family protein [Luteolibacter flavescens]